MIRIKKLTREADFLAARFYKLEGRDRQQAARDWEQKVKEAADLIKLVTSDAQKCRKKSTSNIAYLTK